jgi:hypothetical protein
MPLNREVVNKFFKDYNYDARIRIIVEGERREEIMANLSFDLPYVFEGFPTEHTLLQTSRWVFVKFQPELPVSPPSSPETPPHSHT